MKKPFHKLFQNLFCKLFRILFKGLALIFVLLICGLIIFRFLENRTPPYHHVSADEMKVLKQFLADQGRNPVDLVIDAFNDHPVVILGEPHRIGDHYLFLKNLIEPLASKGIENIAIEFFLISNQKDMDELMSSSVFDEALARRIILAPRICFYFQELMDILKEVWKVNRSGKMRVLCLGQYDIPIPQRKINTDKRMASIIAREANSGTRTLVYCGNHHAYTKYSQAEFLPWLKPRRQRMGNYLLDGLQQRGDLQQKPSWTPFYVTFHSPMFKKYYFLIPILLYDKPFTLPFDGIFDQLFATLKEPVAFKSEKLPDWVSESFSYYSIGYGKVPASLYADAYIYLKPMSKCSFIKPLENLSASAEERALLKSIHGERLQRLYSSPKTAADLIGSEGITPSDWISGMDCGNLDISL
ncbi:MAG: hypothetical protein CVV64_15570 [Candidatus Wallbacteria bacterium HGW-Wallbacteria-1]|jgi:hypothetical protein|uniref:Haem-binding uptake Tiki superfamily ChaN domain-containing protein n=1 Tax=Candidatus Wallbacteria bacterium HGW-Wallbacteria-1 TaxID=2013854 RepID=A0A2N1PLK7_9BACT|nr:MAG: hypothetical protein CVV64_15570 [Candidatus Wallbacteria bacterium HGW-Wallbacteria-1]